MTKPGDDGGEERRRGGHDDLIDLMPAQRPGYGGSYRLLASSYLVQTQLTTSIIIQHGGLA